MKLYDIANELGSVLKSKQLNVVTAESCTGGYIAQAITAIPGSSSWFQQGWVTYSNESKTKELDVPAELIVKYGAVSEPVIEAMATGALINSNANIALASSGVAGPDGGTLVNPVGTVWTAIAIKDNISSNIDIKKNCLHLKGSRESIRIQTVEFLLNNLITILRGK